jgi:phage terminase small subunit
MTDIQLMTELEPWAEWEAEAVGFNADLDFDDEDMAGDIFVRLNERQKKFVLEYLVDGNAGKAALRAGFAVASTGSGLLKNKAVSACIRSRMRALINQSSVDEGRVVKEEACIAFSDPLIHIFKDGCALPPDLLPEEVRRAVASFQAIPTKTGMTYVYKFHDKGKSLERLGRFLGMYKDKIEVDVGGALRDRMLNAQKRLEEEREEKGESALDENESS